MRWTALPGAALQAAALLGIAAAAGTLDAAALAFTLASAALCAGEIALSPEPRLPLDLARREGGWAAPAAVSGASLLALQVAAVTWRGEAVAAWAAAGQGLALWGGALRLWAIRALGASFRTEHEVSRGQPLVRSGPYAWFRHPSELGLLAFALGAASMLRSWPAAAVWAAALLPSSLVRIRAEERLLRAAFGAEYGRAATPRTACASGRGWRPWRTPRSTRSATPSP